MSFLSSIFKPTSTRSPSGVNDKYVFDQQSGCGIAIYHQNGGVTRLFFEIESCSVDRTITDIGGSFQFTVYGTDNWDEKIRPDDYVRIFLGDQVISRPGNSSAYNFAASDISQTGNQSGNKRGPDKDHGLVFVPIPGAGGGTTKKGGSAKAQINFLAMYERMVGKVDRVERSKSAPSEGGGSIPSYTISGRSIGAIIQDVSLYYNQWLPGINATNVFYNSKLPPLPSPNEMVLNVLSIVLSAVPLPQWKLPAELVKDLNLTSVVEGNKALAAENLQFFIDTLNSRKGTEKQVAGEGKVYSDLQKLANEVNGDLSNSPFLYISTRGIAKTFGQVLDTTLLSSQTTGLFDMVKHLSNDSFNEFFLDMCPGGDPENSFDSGLSPVPTIVMRQRPYDITEEMLANAADIVQEAGKSLSLFPRSDIPQGNPPDGVATTLLDKLGDATIVFGALQDPDIHNILESADLDGRALFSTDGTYTPSLLEYQVGISGHDRLNAFLCLGNTNYGQATQDGRIAAAANGAFQVDIDSIRKFGFRIMEISTQYAQQAVTKDGSKIVDWTIIQKMFSQTIANWYFLNHIFLNGRLKCRFLPQARLGVPCKYFETRITPDNPYPKMELFYVQGVTDSFQANQPITTTLTVIRGMRYKLQKNSGLPAAAAALDGIKSRVQASFSELAKAFGGLFG